MEVGVLRTPRLRREKRGSPTLSEPVGGKEQVQLADGEWSFQSELEVPSPAVVI